MYEHKFVPPQSKIQKQPLEVFCEEIGVPKNFAWKHLWYSLFLIKLKAFRSATLKRDSTAGVFLQNLKNFLRTPILKNICERLLLLILSKTLSMSKPHNIVILQRMNGLILLYSDLSLTFDKKDPCMSK